ncbi:interferon alpha/beta receptor 2-like isoform X3 [Xyrichtys novacula]|uniref:Interferon alpha/beta receptor 2-like isoform X3 n=1 Tax=Xyrichtys novacula TaxID=13765 RepID=A0AAV1GYJ9_XYRNO|nr:interferon alpha/beta receptor 2-like isoform X3 [Xyrichtys novacula]
MMMMEMKTLLLLQLQLGVCVSLPPPSSVSISSFNMQHTLSFLPSLESPTHCRYAVQTVRLSRRKSWRSVAACSELMAGQTCNLTLVFKDPFESYLARVKAYTSSQTSNWTQSAHFQPLTDTVFGPPGLTVSGCGNCLLLHLTVPASGGLKQQLQLRDLYRSLEFQVKRTRDGAQYLMSVPFSEQVVISYLQTGVEYCVSVRVSGLLTSTSSLFSQPHCAFTSPPSPLDKSVLLVLGLTGALCALCLFLSGLVIYRGGRSFRRCSLLSALVCQ